MHAFCCSLTKDSGWDTVENEIRYLHKFVSDKLANHGNKFTNACHLRLKPEFAEKAGIHMNNCKYSTAPQKYKGETVTFDFYILDVQLFCFNTTVCILAIQIRFADNDPFRIAAAQYYLRKISKECITVTSANGRTTEKNFIEIAERLFRPQIDVFDLDFFFYASPGTERANFFTYIDVPEKKDYSEELFYLKWCYNDGFVYDELCSYNGDDYVASSNTVWGISPSAAVCLVNRGNNQREFIEKTFQTNFQNQYLHTYILLLHQKYTMYLFLTKLSTNLGDDLELMEDYKRRLYEFESQYMFSYISDVPQYQKFYEKTEAAFLLKTMFQDVQEPLSRLSEIQRQNSDEAQRRYDHRINTALTTLSLLTVVSALTDASGITSNLNWLIPPVVSKIIQIATLVLVFTTSLVMFIRLFSLKNSK